MRNGSSESVNNYGELIGPQSDPKWPAQPLYLHFPHFTAFARFTFSTKYNLHFQQIQSAFSLEFVLKFIFAQKNFSVYQYELSNHFIFQRDFFVKTGLLFYKGILNIGKL